LEKSKSKLKSKNKMAIQVQGDSRFCTFKFQEPSFGPPRRAHGHANQPAFTSLRQGRQINLSAASKLAHPGRQINLLNTSTSYCLRPTADYPPYFYDKTITQFTPPSPSLPDAGGATAGKQLHN